MTLFDVETCLACRLHSHNACRRGPCSCPDPRHAIPTQRTPSCRCGCDDPADPAERAARSLALTYRDFSDLVTPDVLAGLGGAFRELAAAIPTLEHVSPEEDS